MVNPLKPTTEKLADRVWRHAGDLRQGMNVYFLRDDGGGITIFDGGTRSMTKRARQAAEQLGPIRRIVLGHSHADHRGIAKEIGAPIYCHPDERPDAEGDGGYHYFDLDRIPFRIPRMAYPRLLAHWDCGPLEIAGTIEEGEDVCGFEVKHFPGHAPGQIGLWRESDRLAIVSDTIYVVDSMRFKPTELPNVPNPIFNKDTVAAIESCRKLAALEPRVVAPGHADPMTGERQQIRVLLEQAADRAAAGTAWD